MVFLVICLAFSRRWFDSSVRPICRWPGVDKPEGWPKLREELLNVRRKQNKRIVHISYEHWRESDHDDLVLAAALACWKATYQRKGTTRLKVVY